MQISPVISRQVLSAPIVAGSSPLAPLAPAPRAVSTPAGAAAVAGAALVAPPVFDFPGILKGDVYDLARGSKVGMFSPKGTATVELFTPDSASFHVIAGAFGVKADMHVAVTKFGEKQVQLVSTSADGKVNTVVGDIVNVHTNYAEFVSHDGKNEHTIIQRDAAGIIMMDTVIPTFGAAHLVLQKHV